MKKRKIDIPTLGLIVCICFLCATCIKITSYNQKKWKEQYGHLTREERELLFQERTKEQKKSMLLNRFAPRVNRLCDDLGCPPDKRDECHEMFYEDRKDKLSRTRPNLIHGGHVAVRNRHNQRAMNDWEASATRFAVEQKRSRSKKELQNHQRKH